MNFPFNVNALLKDEISRVDNHLDICRQNNGHGFKNLQRMLYEIVDKIGEASAKAQNLPGTITTGKRLETANQRLYILKDIAGGEKSSVIGILKVGTKKLFVYDSLKVQHELDPLCVLDFYVHESRQREGFGYKLLEFMLRNEGIRVEHLAIDRPSPKFLGFLKKHYNLINRIPQVNNFVIFDQFFNGRNNANRGRNNYGANNHKANNSSWNPLRPPSGRRSITPSKQLPRDNNKDIGRMPSRVTNQSSASPQQHHMGAGEVMYSRHRSTPPSNHNNGRATPTLTPPNSYFQGNSSYVVNTVNHNNFSPSPASNTNPYFNGNGNWNKATSTQMYFATGTGPSALQGPSEHLNHDQVNGHPRAASSMHPTSDESALGRKGPASTPNAGNRLGMNSTYGSGRNSPANFQASRMQELNRGVPVLPDIPSGPPNPSAFTNNGFPESLVHRPPSGKRSFPINGKDPPMLQREGPPHNYKEMMGVNQDAPMRNDSAMSSAYGYEKAYSPQQPPTSLTPNCYRGSSKPPYAAASSPFGGPSNSQRNTSWTVFGVLRDQRLNQNINSRYNPGRLW